MLTLFSGFNPAPLGPLIAPLIVLVIVGLCMWLIETYVHMAPPVKVVLRVVVVLLVVLWLLRSFGVI